MIRGRNFCLLFSILLITFGYIILNTDNLGNIIQFITRENCMPDIVEGYDLSMIRNIKQNQDFYNPQNTGVFVYKISAFAVNIACHYTFFVGFLHRDKFNEPIVCVFKYKDSTVASVKATITRLPIASIALKYKYHSAFIKCPEIEGKAVASKVSIFSPKQDKNKIKIQWIDVVDRRNHTVPETKGLAICLNTIYNQTSVWSLAEWMETQRLMGVDKVILYGYKNLSYNVLRLVKHYQKIGFLHVQTWNHGWPLIHNIHIDPLSSQFNSEAIPDSTSLFSSNNDCLYRFGNQYQHLIHIDTDEYMVATNTRKIKTYQEIIAGKEKFNAIYFIHARFCVPYLLHLLNTPQLETAKNQFRESYPSFSFPWSKAVIHRKTIFKPSAVSVFGIHSPWEWCLEKSEIRLDIKEAQLNHYRYRSGNNVCPVLDKSMSPFKHSLHKRVKNVVQLLSNIKQEK